MTVGAGVPAARLTARVIARPRMEVEMGLELDSATRAQANDLKLKLRALGVNLDNIHWQIEAVYWNPFGFDFTAHDWRRVQVAADKSPSLGQDSTDMPGYDPWRKAGLVSVGFTHADKPPYVHLDVALNRPGLCRVYIRPHGPTLVRKMGLAVDAASVYAADPIVRKVVRALSVLRLERNPELRGAKNNRSTPCESLLQAPPAPSAVRSSPHWSRQVIRSWG